MLDIKTTLNATLRQVNVEKKDNFSNSSTFSWVGKGLADPHKAIAANKTFDKKTRLHINQFYKQEFKKCLDKEELVKFFRSLPESARMVFNHLIWLASKGLPLEPSQSHMGALVDIGRQQVNKHIALLKYYGMVDVYHRGKHKTAVYKINPLFYKTEIWQMLQEYIPLFKSFMLGIITFGSSLSPFAIMMNKRHQSQKVTVLKNIKTFGFKIGGDYINACAREGYGKKEELSMSPMVDRITQYLHLTPAGKCKALAFPENVLEYVDVQCQRGLTLANHKSPVDEFFNLCEKRCAQLKIEPNWNKMYAMRRLEGIPVDEKVLAHKQVSPSSFSERKQEWTCSVGCMSFCDRGNSKEHQWRSVRKLQHKDYTVPYVDEKKEVPFCPLQCAQPCYTTEGYTGEHKKRYKHGLDFLTLTAPEKVEVWKSQFILSST